MEYIIQTRIGSRLSYSTWGNPSNPTVVFAHPLLWGPSFFDSFIQLIAKQHFVIAVDIHGHGNSEHYEDLTLERMTVDFADLLIQLNFEPVHWIGVSIGGMIGMRLAISHAELLKSLVLISTTARLDPPAIKQATMQLWKAFRDGTRKELVAPSMPYFFSQSALQANIDAVRRHSDALLHWKDIGGMFETAMAVFDRGDISDKLHNIHLPTIAIAGTEDPTTPPTEAEFISSQISRAAYVSIPNANHLLAIEYPDATYNIIHNFLRIHPELA